MKDFEKLGVFYLGREFDSKTNQPTDNLVLYDSKDLVTHALCVGMTGSGKTGLGITLIEEAALDGVPAIVIDPKGDLTNLLLTFPELRPEDFAPWVNEDDARRAGRSAQEFAADEAERWKRGLADWGEDGGRIRRLRDAAEFTIYTPGSGRCSGIRAQLVCAARGGRSRAGERARADDGTDRIGAIYIYKNLSGSSFTRIVPYNQISRKWYLYGSVSISGGQCSSWQRTYYYQWASYWEMFILSDD